MEIADLHLPEQEQRNPSQFAYLCICRELNIYFNPEHSCATQIIFRPWLDNTIVLFYVDPSGGEENRRFLLANAEKYLSLFTSVQEDALPQRLSTLYEQCVYEQKLSELESIQLFEYLMNLTYRLQDYFLREMQIPQEDPIAFQFEIEDQLNVGKTCIQLVEESLNSALNIHEPQDYLVTAKFFSYITYTYWEWIIASETSYDQLIALRVKLDEIDINVKELYRSISDGNPTHSQSQIIQNVVDLMLSDIAQHLELRINAFDTEYLQ